MTSTNEIVFLGSHTFTFDLPPAAEEEEYKEFEMVSMRRFEAVRKFRHPDEVLPDGERAFMHAQAVCVSEVENYYFRGVDLAFVLVSHEAVRWILCFPLVRQWDVHYDPRISEYAPRTHAVPPDGDDVFYHFTGAMPNRTPIRAVPDLDSLKFLSPLPQSKLALVRAKDWRWDGEAVLVAPQHVLELEIILDSEVRVL